jgi:hypothetical protein
VSEHAISLSSGAGGIGSGVYCPSRRGEANRLRKGKPKTHRNHQPVYNGKTPRGMAAKVVACFRQHDWRRNKDLIELRRVGYTPFTREFDPNFVPKPMRITPRSESREALTSLSLVLAANCDYSPDSDYLFETMLPVEEIARRMNALHVYDNGRKAYDVLLHALRVMEQLDYVVVHRDRDADSGQNKPMRIFLTDKCFTSRGISVENVREWLHKYRQWAIASGLAESMQEKYQRHLLKMARMGINIDRHHSLKNRLKQIKRWVVSPELRAEKVRTTVDLGAVLDEQARKVRQFRSEKESTRYQNAWRRYIAGGHLTMAGQLSVENAVKKQFPTLLSTDSEKFYQLLLERAGVPLS